MILITGGTGFIGQRVVKDLLSQGEEVRLLARDPAKAKALFPEAEAVKGELLDLPSLIQAAKGIDMVIHLAGLISYTLPKQELFRVNVEGTRNLLDACKGAEKFLFSSSVSVYGETRGKASESTPPSPRNFYGESKLAAERAVLASSMPALCCRLSVVFGAGSPIWGQALRFFSKGFPVPKTSSVVNLIHVSDVSRAFQLGLEKGQGIYNIAGEKAIPFMELATLLSSSLGIKPRFWPAGLVKFLARFKGKSKDIEAFILNRDYDISKARQELGFSPQASLEQELRAMAEWYKSLPAGGF